MTNRFLVAGEKSKFKTPDESAAGFGVGLWHGIIMPLTFVIGVFNKNISISETHNNGTSYKIGFSIGAVGITGGVYILKQFFVLTINRIKSLWHSRTFFRN